MGDVVNLNKFRKALTRKAEEEAAEVNRVRFGRRRHEKATERATLEKEKADLDGKKRDETHDTNDPGAPPEKPAPKSP
ncbi:MAG: hypothetical protein ACI82H_000608 [Alphaproteobacteria bacterium]|jgi:hypothetical protein